MNARVLLVSLAACLGAAVACTSEVASSLDDRDSDPPVRSEDLGTNPKPTTETTRTGLPCDVSAPLKSRCQTCHGTDKLYGAPNSLVTYDDLMAPGAGGAKTYERVLARMKDEARPMPPVPNPRVAATEVSAFEAWVKGGAKASSEACTSEKPDDGVKPLSCKPDTILKAAKPFTMQAGGDVDQYVCFGVDVNVTKKRHITALAPHTDNKKILHHILLFQAPKAESPEPTPCAAFGSATWKLVAGWAPGGANVELPPEAGYPEEQGTTHYVLQLHYNRGAAGDGAGQVDNSGYELCTTENLRPNDAGVLAFGSTKFSIPPRSTTTISCDYKLPATFKTGTKFFNASPHMHTRGTAMATERIPGGNGAPEKIFDQPAFDFANQSNYPVSSTVNAGDVIRTRCTWKNPGTTTIGFGEGTDDEMCFDFISYYPNIPDKTLLGLPLFTWVTPSATAQCSVK